jgi:hypothetical protein
MIKIMNLKTALIKSDSGRHDSGLNINKLILKKIYALYIDFIQVMK